MKRNEIIIELVKEGLSEKTLANFTDGQIKLLADRMLEEQVSTSAKGVTYLDAKDPMAAQKAKTLNSQGVNTKMEEDLIGKQKNIDKNHNGNIDSQDFKILRNQDKKKNIDEKDKGNLIKTKKTIYDKALKDLGGEDGVINFLEKGTKDKEKIKSKKKETKEASENNPSAGLSKEKKSEVVKKAKKGEDIGKKGKGFEKVAKKAAEKYDSKEKGEKVAAAAMWKNVKREQNETLGWVRGVVENKYFHNFTSKGEIMELIATKLNEQAVEEKMVLPDFLTSKSIKANQNNEDKEAPVTKPKPTTKPDTKPGKPKHTPFNPGPKPNPGPQAEIKNK